MKHPSNIPSLATLMLLLLAMHLPQACDKVDIDNEEPIQTLSDYEGNLYRIVQIGEQWWMASNLKTTHYADGTAIPVVESVNDWEALDMDDKAYCYYNNDDEKAASTYGALYTWSATLRGAAGTDYNPSQIQGVCPDGWHVPSDAEWKELEVNLGMGGIEADTTGPRGLSVGSQLAVNRDLWADGLLKRNPVFGTSGFMALPGGGRRFNGTFGHKGDNANFWTATEKDPEKAWGRHMYSKYTTVHRYENVKSDGFSVRCVKDY